MNAQNRNIWSLALQFAGATPLAWRARRDLDLLKAEIDFRASTFGKCWIEKLEIECLPPSAAAGSPADPRTELRGSIAEDILRSGWAQKPKPGRSPRNCAIICRPESRAMLGSDETSFEAAVAALAEQGADDVLARLRAPAAAGEALMRIARLDLHRYGKFTERTIDFGARKETSPTCTYCMGPTRPGRRRRFRPISICCSASRCRAARSAAATASCIPTRLCGSAQP